MTPMDRATVCGLILWAAVVPVSLIAVTLAWRRIRRHREDMACAARAVGRVEARRAEAAYLEALYATESAEEPT